MSCDANQERIRIVERASREAGSCNFCNRNSMPHRVREVTGAGLVVRFCNDCAREFATAVGYVTAPARKEKR